MMGYGTTGTLLSNEILAGIGLAVERLEDAWLPAILFGDPDMHAYEALRIDQFSRMLEIALSQANGPRYLEVGCGIGSKLVVAHHAGLEAHGIEARAQYATAARYICPEASIEIADARHYTGYDGFDIIYCYRPLIDESAERVFEGFLTSQMRQGAVLMLPLRDIRDRGWTEAQPNSFVWSK